MRKESQGSRAGAGKAITLFVFPPTENHQNGKRWAGKGLKMCSIHMFSRLFQGVVEAECLLE